MVTDPVANFCTPWSVTQWEDEFKARVNSCSKTCGGGKRKQQRTFSPPSALALQQENRIACDYNKNETGGDMGWPAHPLTSNDPWTEHYNEDCNLQPCPFDCVLQPIDNNNWEMGTNALNQPIMKSVQLIKFAEESGGKPCPTLAMRTRIRTWSEHCENTILKDCKSEDGQLGCTTKGPWSECDSSTSFKYRNTVKKSCNKESATGMIMTYKEAKNCAQPSDDHNIHESENAMTPGHFRSATGSSGSSGLSGGDLPSTSQGQPAHNPADAIQNMNFDAYPNQKSAAYQATGASE
jgi:hypothetical protein